MAAASPYVRESAPSGFALGAGVAALIGVAVACGFMLAVGEIEAAYVALSVVAAMAVLVDYRVGVVLLIVFLPFSLSNVFPHELMGVKGLNPINALIVATLGSYLVHGGLPELGRFVPRPLWLLLVPFLVAGFLGVRHVDEIYPVFYEDMTINFTTATGYLRDMVFKPALIVVVALLVAVAVQRSQKPERFILPIAISVWGIALVEVLFVIASGVHIAELASPRARTFFLQIGLHANGLGRLLVMAYALLLFTWWETKDKGLKLFLFFTLNAIGFAVLLTFSRAAFLGIVLVSGLFVVWKYNARKLGLALLGLLVVVTLAPGYLYRRITMGFDTGNVDTVSAGRVESIWMPLLGEIWKTPPWGNGLGAIMWSEPMHAGLMEPVIHPHNAFLEAYLNTGIIGLACALVFYYTVWRGFLALGSHAFLSPTLRGFFQGACAGLVMFFVTALAGSSFLPVYEWSYLWIAIGLMYGLRRRSVTG